MNKNEAILYRYSVDFNAEGNTDFQYEKVGIPCELTRDCFYGRLGGKPESLRSALSQKSCGKVFSDNDNEFHVFLEEENDERAKSLLAERARERYEEIKSLCNRYHSALWFLEKEPREQKERKERADRDDFEKIVLFLAETWYETRDNNVESEISAFEEAIQEHGRDVAYFGTAKSHWNAIQFDYYSYHNSPFFSADYDDRTVCEWEGSYEEFEKLFQRSAPNVYDMYRARLREEKEEEKDSYSRI